MQILSKLLAFDLHLVYNYGKKMTSNRGLE